MISLHPGPFPGLEAGAFDTRGMDKFSTAYKHRTSVWKWKIRPRVKPSFLDSLQHEIVKCEH